MAQHFLLTKAAKTLTLGQVFAHDGRGSRDDVPPPALVRNGRRAGLPALRRPRRLRLPPPEWRASLSSARRAARISAITSGTLFASHKLPLQSLSRRHRDLLQRGQRQVGARNEPRPWPVLQDRVRVAAQAARSDGGRVEGPRGRRGRQSRGGRFRLFRRLREACQPRREAQGSALRRQPVRQTQGGHHHPRARRQVGPGGVSHGRPSPAFHQVAHRQGQRRQRRRSWRTGTSFTAASK